MPLDYQKLRDENLTEYGLGKRGWRQRLLGSRYSERSHFVFEIVQNAEDALRRLKARGDKGASGSVRFSLFPDHFEIRHHGIPFSEGDVRAITQIGESTKSEDLTAIGKHGIGFKSVFAYTDFPEIHSGEEHFGISDFVQPQAIAPRATAEGETLIYAKLNPPNGLTADQAFAEIAQKLPQLGIRSLLFLKHVDAIHWQVSGGESGSYIRKDEGPGNLPIADHVRVIGQRSDLETDERWLLFREPVVHEGKDAGAVELGFMLTGGPKSGIRAIENATLSVFFPTELETHTGFLIQGPYRTTLNRDTVPRDDGWNRDLVVKTAALLVTALLRLREGGLFDAQALRTLPLNPAKFGDGTLFRPLFDSAVMALKREQLVPTTSGHHAKAEDCRFGRADKLRELLPPAILGELLGLGRNLEWVTPDITENNKARDAYEYLRDQVGIGVVATEDAFRAMKGDFLPKQPVEFLAQLLPIVGEQPYAFARVNGAEEMRCLRLRDGSSPPILTHNKPSAFLPSEDVTDFPTIRPELVENPAVLAFLRTQGLSEPDLVDDIIKNVIPRYSLESSKTIPPSYSEDIGKLVRAIQTDLRASQLETLLKALRSRSWVKCRNAASGELSLERPTTVMFGAERLRSAFAASHDVFWKDDDDPVLRGDDARKLLENAGVGEGLIRILSRDKLSTEYKSALRIKHGSGWSYDISEEDWDLRGLDDFPSRLTGTPALAADSAAALWWLMVSRATKPDLGFFNGSYTWHYRKVRDGKFPARFIRKLQETPWIPSLAGQLRRPREVFFSEVPDNWKEHPCQALQDLLGFKPEIVHQLAMAAGVDAGMLELVQALKAQGISTEAIAARFLRSKKESPDEEEGNREAAKDGENSREPLSDRPNPSGPNPEGKHSGGGGKPAIDPDGSRTRFRTYVEILPSGESDNRSDEQKRRDEKASAVGKRGLEIAIEEERARHPGRLLEEMSHYNPGYDIISREGDATRYIEVKALRGAWSRPVTLSKTEWQYAVECGDSYSVHVVEDTDGDNPVVHVINGPALIAQFFSLDPGWAKIAAGQAAVIQPPIVSNPVHPNPQT